MLTVAVALCALAALLAAGSLWRLARSPSAGPVLLLLRRARPEQLGDVARALPAGSEARGLIEDALASPTPEAAEAAVAEHLTTVEGWLTRGDSMPRAAARLSLLAGNAGAVLLLLGDFGGGEAATEARGLTALWPVVTSLVAGALGATLSALFGRLRVGLRGRRRAEWQELAEVVTTTRG